MFINNYWYTSDVSRYRYRRARQDIRGKR